jgi:ankyrin repeat protein
VISLALLLFAVFAQTADGTTALHKAARADDLKTAESLVRAGANVRAVNRYGVTPLSLACTNGSAAMIELLLRAGADPNTAVPEGETALMTAALTGKPQAIRVLLGHGANVNAKESWRGQTALMWAAAEGHAEAVQVLIEHKADIRARSNAGFTPLLFAARDGHMAAVRVLLEAGADVNESLPGRNARRGLNAAATTPAEIVTGANALMLAIGNAHFELAALLLDRRADPNADGQGWTALHQITWIRKPGLGGNNPAPDGSGNMDSLELVRKLVAKGANVNARITRRPNPGTTDLNMIGATPFLMAARTADAELMRLLVQLGADPLLPNEDNTTPVLVAAGVGTRFPGQEDPGTESEVLEAVKLAVELGGDVNTVDKNGETVMHGAAYKLARSSVQFLVDKGAKIEIWNRENKFGWTPLRIVQGIVQRDNNTRPSSPPMVEEFLQVMGTGAAPIEGRKLP